MRKAYFLCNFYSFCNIFLLFRKMMNESLYRVGMLYFMISITGFRSFYIVDKRKFIALSNLIQKYICIIFYNNFQYLQPLIFRKIYLIYYKFINVLSDSSALNFSKQRFDRLVLVKIAIMNEKICTRTRAAYLRLTFSELSRRTMSGSSALSYLSVWPDAYRGRKRHWTTRVTPDIKTGTTRRST